MPDSYWPSSKALSTRAACLVVSSLSGDIGECDENSRGRQMPEHRAQRHKTNSRARPSSGLEAGLSEPCNHHNKRARQGAYNFTLMQRITRRMSSPLLFHNRQIIMATGGSFDKPVERVIRGKVSSYQIGPTATQPLIRSSSQLTSLLRPSILTITNDSWQHRHHVAMREQDGGNGESRKPGVSRQDTCSASCDSADFSIQIVSEEFVGKVRSLNYPECLMSDVPGRPPCSVTA